VIGQVERIATAWVVPLHQTSPEIISITRPNQCRQKGWGLVVI